MLIKYCFRNGNLGKLKELDLLHLAAEKGNLEVSYENIGGFLIFCNDMWVK